MKKFFDLFKRNKHEAEIEEKRKEIEEERKQALSIAFRNMIEYAREIRQGPYLIDNDIWYN